MSINFEVKVKSVKTTKIIFLQNLALYIIHFYIMFAEFVSYCIRTLLFVYGKCYCINRDRGVACILKE